ncbi:hypothetical protein PMAG_a0092 [Pseudoalteromonas mariniglutinosa NCIMB 1770]|nr:hypothetical protein [Pseudoalteromonas mariniglutinosa NCIMB 1770]
MFSEFIKSRCSGFFTPLNILLLGLFWVLQSRVPFTANINLKFITQLALYLAR